MLPVMMETKRTLGATAFGLFAGAINGITTVDSGKRKIRKALREITQRFSYHFLTYSATRFSKISTTVSISSTTQCS